MDLMQAVKNRDLSTVKQLVKNGANINERSRFNDTALIWASIYGENEIIKFLVENGADVNQRDNDDGYTPLIGANRNNNIETVKLLIELGADVNQSNQFGDSPLSSAKSRGHDTIVKILKNAGAK